MVNLETRYVGLQLKSPIIVSSSGLTADVERMRKCQDNGAGAVIMKSFFEDPVTRKSPTPRFKVLKHQMDKYQSFTFFSYEQASEWDITRYAEEIKRAKKELQIKIIPSINCFTDECWIENARVIEKAGADAIELNTSCPHSSLTFRGLKVEESIVRATKLVCNTVKIPVTVKISSMLTSPLSVAKSIEEVGASGITMLNRMTGLEIDIDTEEPILHGGYGGHGGPWAIQYPLRWISEVRPQVKMDIAASSGVVDWRGVVKYLLVGANVVQVCTVVFLNGYQVIGELLTGLQEYMNTKGYKQLDDFRGKVNSKIRGTAQVDRTKRFVSKIRPDLEAPCNFSCPAEVPAQSYVRLIAEGKFDDALKFIYSKNPFQSICGRVCYHPCEENCTRGDLDDPIAIKALKRFVIEWGNKHQKEIDKIKIPHAPSSGKRIAVIGAGPAGLSAAHDLTILGHKVTVFEKKSVPGGMLRTGIPEYRLPKKILDRELKYISNQGVRIKTNTVFGKDISLQTLKKEGFDAVLLTLGATQSLELTIPGAEAEQVIDALEFLSKINLKKKIPIEKRIAVIGGGNSAIDAARCAVRLGSREVYLVYRRTRDEMPANINELQDAEEEGVRIIYLAKPLEIITEKRKVTGLKCVGGYLSQQKKSGRRIPVAIKGMHYILPVNMIITALGQIPDTTMLEQEKVQIKKNGVIAINEETGATNLEGVFAAGDAAGRPGSVIEAIAHGKQVAVHIDQYIHGIKSNQITPIIKPVMVEKEAIIARHITEEERPRVKLHRLNLRSRKNCFKEVDLTLSKEQAITEAKRCLACGCGVGCDICYKLCLYSAVEQKQNKYIINEEECDGCGLCVERCPNEAISLIERTNRNKTNKN